MDAKDVEQLIKWLGLPGALLAIFIILLAKGKLLWSRELDGPQIIIKIKDEIIVQLRKDLQDCDAEAKIRFESMKVEKNFWRQIALGGQEELERATRTVEKAVEKLPRSTSSGPPEGE